jgi:glutamate-1-semialdehyde 2,1-aminomutase
MKTATASQITESYIRKTPSSQARYAQAREIFPSGVTHDARYLLPHPIFIDRADGSRKWDIDGNCYVDYFGGHGALLLGHGHPAVVEAVRRQASRGVHYGGSHELELEWAELVRKLIPCAERVRFTVTGTEATHLGLRVARAYTGKPAILRFSSHFHGWHDHVAFSDRSAPPGILQGVVDGTVLCPPNDIEAVKTICEQRDDIAAIIVEPTGATFGQVPLPPQFLTDLRHIATKHGIVLIFDEVICGFRCSPGGAQGFYGVTPDLTTLAKVIAGGYPGAALVGRADIMSMMDHRDGPSGPIPPIVPHPGTYNAGPISACAGIATLKVVASTDAIETANRTAKILRDELNAAIGRAGASWCVYGAFSAFHIFTNPDRQPVTSEDIMSGRVAPARLKGSLSLAQKHKIRIGMLCGGVDPINWPGGLVSCRHGADDVDRTLTAFASLLKMLADEGEL